MVTHGSVPFADPLGGDRFRLYFSGRDELNRSQIGFFEIDINDPQRILSISETPVVRPGELGTFDESGTMVSWLVNHENCKYLYYIGWNEGTTVPFRNSIGLAISQDGGNTFVKYSNGPILDRNIYDPYFVGSSCVLSQKGKWKMWYLSCTGWEIDNVQVKHKYLIKYAESPDGIDWQPTDVVCIDFEGQEEYAISRPSVMRENQLYRMWYSYTGDSYRIGYAESREGINWTRKDEEVGINVSSSGWDSEMIEYPFVFDHQERRYMLYNGNDYGRTGIGLAQLVENSN